MTPCELRLDRDGAEVRRAALSAAEVLQLSRAADAQLGGRLGVRLYDCEAVRAICSPAGPLGRIAGDLLGSGARPVRAVLFDKTPANNWAVGWHQDRTIAVRSRTDAPGFGPWSAKDGAAHVEPPFAIIEAMITLRAHLDDCDERNAPLLIVKGSHRLGRIAATDARLAAQRSSPVACIARAGDVWCYATSILHASRRAAEPRRRRVLQVDFSDAPLPHGLEWLGV